MSKKEKRATVCDWYLIWTETKRDEDGIVKDSAGRLCVRTKFLKLPHVSSMEDKKREAFTEWGNMRLTSSDPVSGHTIFSGDPYIGTVTDADTTHPIVKKLVRLSGQSLRPPPVKIPKETGVYRVYTW
ncbi:MAG: hypothetical protein HGB03_02545 [Candidatus Yonathbacteria bacterium]|nr:hypothetical protein [Candidatus Yonathbacteria bacterium]NTW47480.1 hypothetical protein [Candidatus Yonathbacteria bacterium]